MSVADLSGNVVCEAVLINSATGDNIQQQTGTVTTKFLFTVFNTHNSQPIVVTFFGKCSKQQPQKATYENTATRNIL